MRLTWLGWAGAELEAGGATVVVDPLAGRGRGVRADSASRRRRRRCREVVPPGAGQGRGRAGHPPPPRPRRRRALAAALAPGAPVLEPLAGGGDALEELALAQAEHELAAAGLDRRRVAPWESVTAGPFTLTALPAVDGIGDPQVSWLVEADGVRILHLGDTTFHGYWWRMARRHGPFDVVLVPVNGAVLELPAPTTGQPAARRARPRPGRDRGRDPRRAPGDPDPRRGLRDRRHLRARRRCRPALRRRSRRAWGAGEDPRARRDARRPRWHPAGGTGLTEPLTNSRSVPNL